MLMVVKVMSVKRHAYLCLVVAPFHHQLLLGLSSPDDVREAGNQ